MLLHHSLVYPCCFIACGWLPQECSKRTSPKRRSKHLSDQCLHHASDGTLVRAGHMFEPTCGRGLYKGMKTRACVWLLGGPQCNGPPTHEGTPVLTLVLKYLRVQHSISKCIGPQHLNTVSAMHKSQYEFLPPSDRASHFVKADDHRMIRVCTYLSLSIHIFFQNKS